MKQMKKFECAICFENNFLRKHPSHRIFYYTTTPYYLYRIHGLSRRMRFLPNPFLPFLPPPSPPAIHSFQPTFSPTAAISIQHRSTKLGQMPPLSIQLH
ncbi:hypothetical protein ACHAXS_012731, partial [Conticribra weissflogii]